MVTVTSLNAADYGLTSGSSNQTANLQAAINAAQTQGLPLFIPPGSYPITSVNITSSVEIYSAVLAAQIVGFGRSPTLNVGSGVAGTRIGPVIIRGLHLYGANQSFPGGTDPAIIQSSEVDGLIIRDCLIRDSGYHAIRLTESSGRIQSNEIPGAREIAIYIYDSSNAVFIDQNVITYSGNNGVYIYRSTAGGDQSVISNNQIGLTSANGGGTGWNGNACSWTAPTT
jgi:hypothetical protein